MASSALKTLASSLRLGTLTDISLTFLSALSFALPARSTYAYSPASLVKSTCSPPRLKME